MKKHVGRATAVVALAAAGFLGVQSAALAGAPPVVDGSDGGAFLCPAVGNDTAAENNGQGWGGPLPNDNYTFLPGHNQAGANADSNSNNTLGPGDSPGPGGANSDWSPLWPPSGE